MIIYLNGHFMPIEHAQISVLDRGFIFGDGVYEVIPVYSRHAFRLQEHLERLQHSLDGVRIPNPYTNNAWISILQELIKRNSPDDQSLYIHITRGIAQRDLAFPDSSVSPTVFLMSCPLTSPSQELLKIGAHAITAIDNRWLRCDIKSISLLPNVLLRQLAADADRTETLLFREDTFLTEGTASNIFMVKNDVLLAPPKDHLMLPGITYDVVLELARSQNIPYQIRRIRKDEVFSADELLMCSSTKEVIPITKLDNQTIGNGFPGPVVNKLRLLYQSYKNETMRSSEC
ncbi:D-amino acid aminotransferase [Ferriphaselus sp. R-1]|uniref:D-amino acid aminotransferase n=1 Tax=Ferriphaselus sp. R-1 TaxID=1485544 RepID=UPI00054D3621|nr:D-amino acid aminotransferase [Ferriphaselus sp. R-1]